MHAETCSVWLGGLVHDRPPTKARDGETADDKRVFRYYTVTTDESSCLLKNVCAERRPCP